LIFAWHEGKQVSFAMYASSSFRTSANEPA